MQVYSDTELNNLLLTMKRKGYSPQECGRLMEMTRQIKEDMQFDIVHFWFIKRDNSERSAYGTRAPDIIHRYGADPRKDNTPPDEKGLDGTFPYFDLDRKAWRCFKPECLVKVDKGYTL